MYHYYFPIHYNKAVVTRTETINIMVIYWYKPRTRCKIIKERSSHFLCKCLYTVLFPCNSLLAIQSLSFTCIICVSFDVRSDWAFLPFPSRFFIFLYFQHSRSTERVEGVPQCSDSHYTSLRATILPNRPDLPWWWYSSGPGVTAATTNSNLVLSINTP